MIEWMLQGFGYYKIKTGEQYIVAHDTVQMMMESDLENALMYGHFMYNDTMTKEQFNIYTKQFDDERDNVVHFDDYA